MAALREPPELPPEVWRLVAERVDVRTRLALHDVCVTARTGVRTLLVPGALVRLQRFIRFRAFLRLYMCAPECNTTWDARFVDDATGETLVAATRVIHLQRMSRGVSNFYDREKTFLCTIPERAVSRVCLSHTDMTTPHLWAIFRIIEAFIGSAPRFPRCVYFSAYTPGGSGDIVRDDCDDSPCFVRRTTYLAPTSRGKTKFRIGQYMDGIEQAGNALSTMRGDPPPCIVHLKDEHAMRRYDFIMFHNNCSCGINWTPMYEPTAWHS